MPDCDLPPAILSVGSTDPLLDDSLWLGTRWQAANGSAELAVFPDCPHGFHMGDHPLAKPSGSASTPSCARPSLKPG